MRWFCVVVFGVSAKFKLNSEPLSPSVAASFECIGVLVCEYIIFCVCACTCLCYLFYVRTYVCGGYIIKPGQFSPYHVMYPTLFQLPMSASFH